MNQNNFYLTKGLAAAKKNVQYRVQILGCEKNIESYKIKVDSCSAMNTVHKRIEATLSDNLGKMERKRDGWRGFGAGMVLFALIREGFTLLKEKL